MNVIAYTRVSTMQQAQFGAGLRLQNQRIEAFALIRGYKIVDRFSDVYTGVGEASLQERENLQTALKESRRRRAPILVDGFDRITRDVETLEQLITDHRVKIISARHGENGEFAAIIAAGARAEAEARRISETTRSGLKKAKESGVRLGNRTNLDTAQRLGQESNRNAAERRADAMLPLILEIRAEGHTTKEAIADELNRRGHLTPRGQRWTCWNVRRLLDRVDNALATAEKRKASADWGSW